MASGGGGFDGCELIVARLRQGPSNQAQEPAEPAAQALPVRVQSRWQLHTIREAIPALQSYSLSGVWRLLRRYGLKLRSSRVQQYSPDPAYAEKVEHVLACLRQTAQTPQQCVCLFLDEMGYTRWPDPGDQWCEAAPAAAPQTDRQQTKQAQWRLLGVLNALTGQVNYLDGYIVGRAKVINLYEQVAVTYAWAERIFVVQDNWSIHKHPDVLTALTAWPTLEPIWLPTYAPWLNPIEKLWRWLRHDVLKLHRMAKDWPLLRKRVNGFLDQFAHGSQALLRYVGLLGQGKLAQAIAKP